MMTAMQAFGWCHQYSIAHLLLARDVGCELFTSGLDASRFTPVVRFGQSLHLGIHAHVQPHYGTATASLIWSCRSCELAMIVAMPAVRMVKMPAHEVVHM